MLHKLIRQADNGDGTATPRAASSSSTAEPKPPVTTPSSTVTTRPHRRAALRMASVIQRLAEAGIEDGGVNALRGQQVGGV